ASLQVNGNPDVFHPGCDERGKKQKRRRLKTLQAAAFYKFKPDLTKSKCRLVVAEPLYRDPSQYDIGERRRVTVAALKAEVHRFASGQGIQVLIRLSCGNHDSGQNFHGRKSLGIAHRRQVGGILDSAAAQMRPDLLVFEPYFVFRWMR